MKKRFKTSIHASVGRLRSDIAEIGPTLAVWHDAFQDATSAFALNRVYDHAV
jgi:hypothetical protein